MLARLKYAIDDLPVGIIIEVKRWAGTGSPYIHKIVFGPPLDNRLLFLHERDLEVLDDAGKAEV